ncbi:hypothetical protein L0F63_001117 [Massospora cicadina]|nr:hypothetical protein L0F63_001117 [Massospora cicadina]
MRRNFPFEFNAFKKVFRVRPPPTRLRPPLPEPFHRLFARLGVSIFHPCGVQPHPNDISLPRSPSPASRREQTKERTPQAQLLSRASSAAYRSGEAPVSPLLSEPQLASTLARSRSDFDRAPSPLVLRAELGGTPPDLRRDSMYSVRTSVTAPVSNHSCPDSPVDPRELKKKPSDPLNPSKRLSEGQESFLSALRSFNQIHSGIGGINASQTDFQQLRDALHNFKISDKENFTESADEGHRKNSLSTTFTGETSGSEHEVSLAEVMGEAFGHAGLANVQSIPRRPSQSSSLAQGQAENAGGGSESASLADELPAISELSPTTLAKRLFSNDNRILPHNEIAEYLGKRGDRNAQVLRAYMDHFNFAGLRLDEAFRSLCAHLYLHGETQVIDRILAEFARRYWHCNPDSVFENQDVVYAVAYSILLLNTDLHVAQSHHKMSRTDFVKNTMSTVASFTQPVKPETEDGDQPDGSGRAPSGDSYLRPASAHHEELLQLLKDVYLSIKNRQILQCTEPRAGPARRTSTASSPAHLAYRGSLYRTHSATRGKPTPTHGKKLTSWDLPRQRSGDSLNPSPMGSHSGTDLFFNATRPPPPQPPSTGARVNPTEAAVYPYHKSGLLVRKHLYERTDRKAPHRTWKECHVVVEGGDLRMYKVDRLRADRGEVADPSTQLGVTALRHCLAVTLPPPGYSASRPHVFALQLPSGGVYLFQATSAELVSAWVVICNFWAARESKEPLPGGICSVDYGWGTAFGGENVEDDDRLTRLPAPDRHQPVSSRQLFNDMPPARSPPNIQEWRPLPCPCEDDQLEALLRQIATLDGELVEHMELRGVIHRRVPPRSPHYAKAFSNWERKSQYLLRELIKYQTYADVLKRTLAANRGLPCPDLIEGDDDATEFIPLDPAEDSSNQP